METSRYLIVGGGLTADGACRGIRELDPDGTIALVAQEPHPPYARPPLSKALWKGGDEGTIWCRTQELDVDLRLGRRIVALDLQAKVATDDRGVATATSGSCSRPAADPDDFRSAATR
jgi:3-phenylpropionate/trans-cinnamate dioxygenase ferredoxin reductase component